jgi:8-oxo-dGTP diphosphatase
VKSLRNYIRAVLNETSIYDKGENIVDSLSELKLPKKIVAGALIKDVQTGKVLLIKRNDPTPRWAMATGKVDDGEDPVDAIEREMYEELFLRPGKVRLNYKGVEYLPAQNIELYYFEGFSDGTFKPHLDEENLDFGWFSLDDLPSPLIGGLYEKIEKTINQNTPSFKINKVQENIQLADKVYFNTKKLSPKVREIITTRITSGDAWTKLITDIYWAILQQNLRQSEWIMHTIDNPGADMPERKDEYQTEDDVMGIEDWKKVKSYYQQLKAYNKNLFPIKDLNSNGVQDIWSLIRALDQRAKILEKIKSLPSVALRNMREDIRVPRNSSEMNQYRHDLEYFLAHYSLLDNRDIELKKFVEKKMFKSGMTLNKLLSFVEEKENLLGGKKFDKDVIKNLIQNNNHGELEVIYESGDIMVVEVSGPYGIKEIGCNSLWCFTYGDGYSRNWSQYSYNDTVYVIIDFSEPSDSKDFMSVVIKPLVWNPKSEDEEEINDETIFDMSNTNRYDALQFLNSVIGIETAKKLLTFYVEPEEEYDEDETEQENPNQLKLFEVRKKIRLIMEQKIMSKHYMFEAVKLIKEAEEKSPTFYWDLTDKGVKDEPSPTYQWDLSSSNTPKPNSYDQAKEYINQALSYIKDKTSAIELIKDLKEYVKDLSASAKAKLTKYVVTSLLGLVGLTTITSIMSSSTSEIEREVVKTIISQKEPEKQEVEFRYPSKSSEKLLSHLKDSEGYRSTFYDLKDGAYTVGWGHAVFSKKSKGSTGGDYSFVPEFHEITPKVTMLLSKSDIKYLNDNFKDDKERLEKAEEIAIVHAEELLKDDIKKAEAKLNKILDDWKQQGIEVDIDQDMYDSMISMIFNMGAGDKFRTSEFLQSVKRGDFENAYLAIEKIDDPKLLKKYRGLRVRRSKEKEMFGTGLDIAKEGPAKLRDLSEVRLLIRKTINNII